MVAGVHDTDRVNILSCLQAAAPSLVLALGTGGTLLISTWLCKTILSKQ